MAVEYPNPVGFAMITPLRAAVKPRVVLPDLEELPLEDEIQRHLDRGESGLVALVGPSGTGKTVALDHLAAVLPVDASVAYFDSEVEVVAQFATAVTKQLWIYTATAPRQSISHLADYHLARWNRDDLIEYLLARHRDRCASVMQRVQREEGDPFQGIPELWTTILDLLAADDSIPNVRSALQKYLEQQLPDTDVVQRSRNACLNSFVTSEKDQFTPPGFAESLSRVLRHRAVQVLLASERIVADLHGDEHCDFLACRLPRELIHAVARLLKPDDRQIERLKSFLTGPPWSHAMAASLLHALKIGWKPDSDSVPTLTGAYLEGAEWPSVNLANANLSEADLSAADLSGANLHGANAAKARLRRTQMRGASLFGFRAELADLSGADLSSCRGLRATFDFAKLIGAVFNDAVLVRASFNGANLTSTSFVGAALYRSSFLDTEIDGADFTNAHLNAAQLPGLKLRRCKLRGARFINASLQECDLEYLNLEETNFEGANLTKALLTGTVMANVSLERANLSEAGLGEIDWEDCSLRDADLTGASFHMGSSRSGLLFTTIASEGTRTGFYTDDFEDRSFKEPEAIRKANLCGADLRGAKIDNTDFYLVDLRDAVYDAKQEEHFRRCGAILGKRG
jgi:uncharacterized protein YjbI with pentapeptide repeats